MEIRTYRPGDCPALAELFCHTVHTVNAADYTPEQLEAWAPGTVDLEGWEQSFREHRTLVAVEGETVLGFGDMDDGGYLDRLYVRADRRGEGVGSVLCDLLERAAEGQVVTHASITARPFFERRGYRVVREQQVERRGVLLTNFVMEKESGLRDIPREDDAMGEIRRGTPEDIPAVAAIYDRILKEEEAGRAAVGWARGVYPTESTAREALEAGELFVMTADGALTAAARINRTQVPVYSQVPWRWEAPPERVMVLHTLVVDPLQKGRGHGSAFVAFYEDYARERGCPYLRMDTNEKNAAARALYARLGYREAGIVPCVFNGIPGVRLVCLEKRLE